MPTFCHPRFFLLTGLVLSLLSMGGCNRPNQAIGHRGLSSDGYGFVQDGPVLAPPAHLMQHQEPAATGR
ncbi:hypothetical protein [Bombella apis]|uniref:hypothetical protein n=1 Tax=Bombella apis TaxID=1785988 RepID=UPI0024A7C6FE|nr:hypothetical protein [Bombella apis]